MNPSLFRAAWPWLLRALLSACDAHRALMGFKDPVIELADPAGPVSLPFREGPGGLVLIKARVNDRLEAEFILDTGAPVTVLLDSPGTRALNVDMRGARRLGPAGDPAVPIGVIEPGFKLDFGGVTLSGLTAVVIPQSSLPCQERLAAVDFQGVIGADLFRHFVVEIDHGARRVRLFDPRTWRPPADATLPLEFIGGHVYTRVALQGEGGDIALRMHIDTGRNSALSLIAGSHPALVMPAAGLKRTACHVQGRVETTQGSALDLALGPLVARGITPQYQAGDPVRLAERNGSIGIGLLRRYVTAFDDARKRMLLRGPG